MQWKDDYWVDYRKSLESGNPVRKLLQYSKQMAFLAPNDPGIKSICLFLISPKYIASTLLPRMS